MQIPLALALPQSQSQSPPSKAAVKNILIRHSCSTQIRASKNYEHPEISHLLKYLPKYYHSFTSNITLPHSLLSKIKKIKKLKKFTGFFPRAFPHKLWLNLLANNRKEIEEIPHIVPVDRDLKPGKSFWQSLYLQKVKFFPNLKRVLKRRISQSDPDASFLSRQKIFGKYIWNMRRLKSLEIITTSKDYKDLKQLLQKLNGMSNSLARLDTFTIDFGSQHQYARELLQYKNVLARLTDMKLGAQLDIINDKTRQIYKNLRSISLSWSKDLPAKPEFKNLLISIQHLSQIKSLKFNSPLDGKHFWEYFKPPLSLRSLKMELSFSGLQGFCVEHWEDLEELDFLEMRINYPETKELDFVIAITSILKKIRRLRSLKLDFWPAWADDYSLEFEPFLVNEIPHLYETLEKFEFSITNWSACFPKFDLKLLEPFCNLKQLKFEEASGNLFKNVGDAVNLLQENQKKGDFPVLEIKRRVMTDGDDLEDFLNKIAKIKRRDKNLKIVLNLTFSIWEVDYIRTLEDICQAIHTVKSIKGIVIYLNVYDADDSNLVLPSLQEVRGVIDKYPEVCNLDVSLCNVACRLEYIKLEGEKSQLYTG